MTDTLRLIAACSAVWVVLALIYGRLAYRAGWNAGYIEGVDYARKHIAIIGR